MSIEEAIRILHPDTTAGEIRKIRESGEDGIKAVEEAILVACEAMEKQVPKKLERNAVGSIYCKCGIVLNTKNKMKVLYYCHNCGQKIDWSGITDD